MERGREGGGTEAKRRLVVDERPAYKFPLSWRSHKKHHLLLHTTSQLDRKTKKNTKT